MSDNIIANVEPGAFNNLFNLRSSAHGHRSVGPFGVFTGLSNLTKLDISENKIVILLDYMFQDLHNLKSLEVGTTIWFIYRDRASADCLAWSSSHWRNVTSLRYPQKPFTPPAAHQLQNLKHLNINNMPQGLFKRLVHLKHLEIDYVTLLDMMSLHIFRSQPHLLSTNTNLSTPSPSLPFKHLVYLTHLNLSHNPISTIEAGMFSDLIRLPRASYSGAWGSHHWSPHLSQGPARVLNVSQNLLKLWKRTPFLPELGGPEHNNDPLACDCRLLWILQRAPNPAVRWPAAHVRWSKTPSVRLIPKISTALSFFLLHLQTQNPYKKWHICQG